MRQVTVRFDGKPIAQGRGKAARWEAKDGRSGVTVRDPAKSRSWKAGARAIAVDELQRQSLPIPFIPVGPVALDILAVFAMPASEHRKKEPRRGYRHTKRGDADNIAKAVKDALTGVMWTDDCQVCTLRVSKHVGDQGYPAFVSIIVTEQEP